MAIEYTWRGHFTSTEANALHAAAFGHRPFSAEEWDWLGLCERHSLGWVTARDGADLVGFVNVLWDGLVHAWIQDVMTADGARRRGVGVAMVGVARDQERDAGCEWLHVDFDDDLRAFYIDACGFTPTSGGVIELT